MEGRKAPTGGWYAPRLGSGACSEILTLESRLAKARAGFRVPQARVPAAAQEYLPGLF